MNIISETAPEKSRARLVMGFNFHCLTIAAGVLKRNLGLYIRQIAGGLCKIQHLLNYNEIA